MDDINRFQWRSREMPFTLDANMDHMVFPGDATFTKINRGALDGEKPNERLYLLQFKANEARRFFFWMQDKDGSEDDALVEKLNATINGVGGDDDDGTSLGAVLRGLQSQAPASPAGGGDASAPALTMDSLQNVFSNMDMPAAPAPAAGTGSGAVSSDALAAAMAGALAAAGGGGERLTLQGVATGDALEASGLLDDAAAVDRLVAHLPEGQRSKAELTTLLRSPQFKQALASLTSALYTPDNYASILANFGIDPSPLSGDDPVVGFLAAVLKSSGPSEPDGDAAPAPAPAPAAAPKEDDKDGDVAMGDAAAAPK